jgi:hypothetical protein
MIQNENQPAKRATDVVPKHMAICLPPLRGSEFPEREPRAYARGYFLPSALRTH